MLRLIRMGHFWVICAIAGMRLTSVFAAEKPEIFVQLGHSGSVNSVAFSPDGRYVLSGSSDNTVKLWDVSSEREVRTFRGHGKGVVYVGFTADGKNVISIGNGSVKTWTISDGENKKTYEIRFEDVALSGDGKYIVSGLFDEVVLWDALNGNKLKVFKDTKDKSSHIRALAISSDGKYAVASYRTEEGKGLIRIWDLFTGGKLKEIKSEDPPLYLVFSSRGQFFVSNSLAEDYSLRLWDAIKGEQVRTLYNFGQGNVPFAAFSPDEKHVLFLKGDYQEADYRLCFEELSTDKEIASFKGYTGPVESVAFSPDLCSFISGGWDSTVRLWDIGARREKKTFKGDTVDTRFSSGYSSKTNYALAGPNIWDVSSGRIVWTYSGPESSLVISPDGQKVLAHAQNVLMTIQDKEETNIFMEEAVDFGKKVFSPDGKYIAWDSDGKIKIWDVSENKKIMTLDAYARSADCMVFYPDSRHLVTVGPGETVDKLDQDESGGTVWPSVMKFWNLQNGTVERSFKTHSLIKVVFAPDGKHFAGLEGAGFSGMLRYYTAGDGEEIRGRFDIQVMGEGDYATDAVFSPDGKYIISGHEDNHLRLWDISSGKVVRMFKGHLGSVVSVSYTGDGNRVVSVGNDGTVRVWDGRTGKEIAQMTSFTDGEWIVITPEGYFDASPDGAKHMNVRVGNEVYSIDSFYEKFFNPVYVASVLGGRKVEAVADIRNGFAAPPDVKIISPEPDAVFSTETISITVSAKDTGGGIDEIRLCHNGKAIGEDQRAVKIIPKDKEVTKTYNVILVDGLNNFRASGFSQDRTESNPCELIVTLTAPSKDVSLYLLVVGINEYKNPALNLNYAEPDARGIADFFRQAGKGLFKNVELIEIYNEQATKETITAKLKQLQNTQPQDVVLIYLASHGENVNDKWYLIPYELTYPEREEEVKIKGLSSDELAEYIKAIKAQKVLVLIDACKSGTALIAFRGFEDRKALSQLSRSTGVHIIAASTKDQFAAEVKDLGHGVFTYTLLEGLKGKASGEGETVTVFKLKAYLDEQLPEITRKYKQEAQYPVGDTKGMDFPLVLIKGSVKNKMKEL